MCSLTSLYFVCLSVAAEGAVHLNGKPSDQLQRLRSSRQRKLICAGFLLGI